MADKQSRLAEIYKAEKERGGGVLSTLGKRAKEKFDPRQMFNQKGFAAAALPSLFKGYDAVGKTKKIKEFSGTNTGGFSSAVLENGISSLITETRQVKIHSQLAAKNSVVLPSMARDMNVTRQNIVKLVKLQGGTATTKADMFFKRAGDREAGYESKFSKAGGVASKTPTKEGDKPKEESGGFFSTLMTTLSGVGGFASKLIGFFSSIFGIILASGIIGQFLADEETRKTVKDFISKVLTKFFNGVSDTFDVIKASFKDEEVQKSVAKAYNSIKDALIEAFTIKVDTFFKGTPFEFNLNLGTAILGAVIAAMALPTIIAGLGASLGAAVVAIITGAIAFAYGKLGLPGAPAPGTPPRAPVPGAPPGAPVPGAPPGAPVPGAPPGAPVPGTPSGAPGKGPIIKPGTIGEKVPAGFNKTAEDKIRERAIRMAAEQGAKDVAKKGAGELLKRFFAGAVIGGPIAAIWAAAYTAYQVIDYLAPDEQQEVIDSVAVLASIQDDINQGGNEKELRKRASLYEAKLKRFGILSQQIESAKVQALPSAPNESGAEAARPAGSGTKPTPAPYSPSANSQAANTTTPSNVPSIPGTSKETSKTPTIEKFDYTKYKELVGIREGGGKHDADNKVGFIGKYQFGAQALETFGYLKAGTSADRNAVYNSSNWTGKNGIASADDFKKATDVQENLMNAYTDINLKGLQKSGVITGGDTGSSVASKLYAAHHGGVGGASKFFKENKDTGDFAFAGASVGKSASLMATAYETGKIGGAEYSGLGGSSGTTVASQTPAMASSLGSMGSSLANLAGSVGSSAVASVAANAPNMGNVIDSASTGLSEMLRMFDNAMASVTNVTNNTTQASAAPQGQGKLPSVYDDTFANLFQRVA